MWGARWDRVGIVVVWGYSHPLLTYWIAECSISSTHGIYSIELISAHLSIVTPTGHMSDIWGFLGLAWLLAEVCFAALMHFAAQSSLNNLSTPLQYNDCPGYIVNRILNNIKFLKTYSLQKFMEGWFCNTPFDEIRIQNVREFLAWAMHASFYNDLTSTQHAKIDETIVTIQTDHNLTFTPGYNPKAKHVSMTLEPLHYIHCPLIIYILIGVKNLLTDFLLLACGFRRLQHSSVRYWHRPRPVKAERPKPAAPAVFFHGITPGW